MKRFTGCVICFLATMLIAAQAAAEVPHLIPVVGMVEDSSDVPLDGTYDVVFALYDAEDALANLWSEEYAGGDGLVFDNGLFRAYLGTQNSLDTYITHFLDNDELWLGMKIGTDVEMTRIRLAAMPWGVEAEHCGQIGDYEADDLQPAIGETACSGNEFLQGWHPSTGAVCNQMSVPAEYLTESEGNAAYVQLPTSDLSTCEFGLAWNGTSGELDCMDEADVESRCYTSHGDDAYLGSDGACHNAPHSCNAEQYMDGNETCQDGPQVCTATQYMDGNGACQTAPHACNANQYLNGDGNCANAPVACTVGQYMNGDGACVDSGFGLVPIGSIIAWHPNLAGVPALPVGWALCDGAVISDADSPLNGQATPDLNSSLGGGLKGYFLRGHTTSGETETDLVENHTHGFTDNYFSEGTNCWSSNSCSGSHVGDAVSTGATTGANSDGGSETRPHSMSVVWVMRIK